MYVYVKVKAGQKKETLIEIGDNRFQFSIKEKAERNMANDRTIQLLKDYYNTENIKIINGHHSPSKMFSVGE